MIPAAAHCGGGRKNKPSSIIFADKNMTISIKYNMLNILKCLVLLMVLAIVAPTDAEAARKKRRKRTNQDLESMFMTFDLGGGLYTYRYKVDGNGQDMKPGGTANICYNKFYYNGFGWGAGIGASYYGAATTFTTYESYKNMDPDAHGYDPEFMYGEQENYDYKTIFDNVSERQHLIQLEVPAMGMYKLKNMTQMWDLTVALGAKLGIPLMKQYKLTDGIYKTSGYFESTNVEYDNLPQHHFGTVSTDQKGKSNLRPLSCSIFLDAGCNYHIDRGRTVYFGLYVSYCVTNLAKSTDGGIVNYDDLSYNGVLGSTLVDKAHLLGVGGKVALCLDFIRIKALFHGQGGTRKISGRSRRGVRSLY